MDTFEKQDYMVCNGDCVLYDGLSYDKAITQAQSSLKRGGYKTLMVRQAIPVLYVYSVTYFEERNAYHVLPMSCARMEQHKVFTNLSEKQSDGQV